MTATAIEWTDAVWNPTRGCSRVSPGCGHCYAERQAARFCGPGQPYAGLVRIGTQGSHWTGDVRLVSDKLAEPLHWRKPRRIFVNSMSDLFHERLIDEEIAAVFGIMAACPQHTFQALTKRADRMRRWFEWVAKQAEGPYTFCCRRACYAIPRASMPGPPPAWPLPNVWLGVSVEDQQRADERIPELIATPAALRFLSCEPLLSPIDFDRAYSVPGWEPTVARALSRIRWVIIGGESGPGARPMDLAWARSIVAQCKAAGIACFVKQIGTAWARWGYGDDADRKGSDMAAWPEDLRVRRWPAVIR